MMKKTLLIALSILALSGNIALAGDLHPHTWAVNAAPLSPEWGEALASIRAVAPGQTVQEAPSTGTVTATVDDATASRLDAHIEALNSAIGRQVSVRVTVLKVAEGSDLSMPMIGRSPVDALVKAGKAVMVQSLSLVTRNNKEAASSMSTTGGRKDETVIAVLPRVLSDGSLLIQYRFALADGDNYAQSSGEYGANTNDTIALPMDNGAGRIVALIEAHEVKATAAN